MLKVLIPTDSEFENYKNEIRNLYIKNQSKICDSSSFESIQNATFFYAFVRDGVLIGAIYFFMDDDDKLFLNAFSKPKNHLTNLLCLKTSLTWFSCDIYAEAQNRASALCLLRCGFKRVKDNLFCYKK